MQQHRARAGAALTLGFAVLSVALRVGASSAGPQPGTSGVPAGGGFPAEPTCTSCHTGFPLNADGHGFFKVTGVPSHYVPGEHYALTVELHHPDGDRQRWGFQLTAISAKKRTGAGEFVITDAPNTQKILGTFAGREYVSHSYFGTGIDAVGGTSWSFEWIAPPAATGAVEFYGAGNASNADGSKEGDRIYSPSPAPLATSSPAAAGSGKARK
jgi:hypothetical protein